MPRNLFVPLAALLLLAPALPAQSGTNVLLIVADDLGVDYVGAYGEGPDPAPTPAIDALAASGVLFRDAWAYSTCSPTRACLNTGRYGYRTGIGAPPGALDPAEGTLPELLDANGSGYDHAWIGKWHLGQGLGDSHPNASGWSHFAGLLGGGVNDYSRWRRTVDGSTAISRTYATTQIVDDALAWIGGRSGRWLCVVAFNAPHEPFHAPPTPLHTQNLTGLDPALNPQPFYKATVEAMDTEIARLLAGLGAQRDDTDVIFVGDNGTPGRVSVAPFTGRHAKGTRYEGGVGVPLIVSGPSVRFPGREVTHPVGVVDLFATMAALAGVEATWPFRRTDAISFVELLTDPLAPATRGIVYAESFGVGADPLVDGWVAARDRTYKLIQSIAPNGAVTEEFYDLSVDPFETADLTRRGLSATQQLHRDALAAHVATVRDTTGRFVPFGSSNCLGANGAPLLLGVGVPASGGSYTLTLTSAAASLPVFLSIGSSRTAYAGLALPFDLTAVGAGSGCLVEASPDLLVSTASSPAGTASFAVPVPTVAQLIAASVYHQAWVIDATAPAGLVVSAGLEAVIGR